MANANMDMKVTVELAEEDRKRMDSLIELLKTNRAIKPYPSYPLYPPMPQVWCSTEANISGVQDG